MYFIENWYKFLFVFLLVAGYSVGTTVYINQHQIEKTEQSLKQFDDESYKTNEQLLEKQIIENNLYILGWLGVIVLVFLIFLGDFRRMCKYLTSLGICLFIFSGIGCYRPFEPVKFEVVAPNEEAFLLPYTGDGKKQTSSNNEEYLKANMVYTKQVQIPQQWVPKGFESTGANGEWRDAAVLIKVCTSPVTREWTAEKNSGTSDKNEAIWVMTSDTVEFSTGWTCTARIASREDAVKFLHNYRNGSLAKFMDEEIRAKIQTEFGLEVTDLPMDTLRKAATPHLIKVVKTVTSFFKERGITITNLGITGGFVYKYKYIMKTMVRVFNAEQDRSVAIAETNAQHERNKRVVLEATGKADSILKTRKAEADGIKMLADAKAYELESAKAKWAEYVTLKQMELQRELLLKWDGRYPIYFMSNGGNSNPNMLLQLPAIEAVKK